jgi:hypothetical protein
MDLPPDPATHKITQPLLARCQADPQASVDALVRTIDAAAPHRSEVEASGLVVRRVIHLVPTLAVRGRAADVVALAERAWVRSITLDGEVHTMGDPAQIEGTPCRSRDADAAQSRESESPNV